MATVYAGAQPARQKGGCYEVDSFQSQVFIKRSGQICYWEAKRRSSAGSGSLFVGFTARKLPGFKWVGKKHTWKLSWIIPASDGVTVLPFSSLLLKLYRQKKQQSWRRLEEKTDRRAFISDLTPSPYLSPPTSAVSLRYRSVRPYDGHILQGGSCTL